MQGIGVVSLTPQQNPRVPTGQLWVFVFPRGLKTFRERGWKVSYFKMNTRNEVTLLKIENAMVMLNYIEKIRFTL